MDYREYLPAPALRGRIGCYWTLRGDVSTAHRVLPDGCSDLLFSFAAPVARASAAPVEGARVIGIMTSSLVATSSGRMDMLGVRFRPGEAYAFLGVAADELRDTATPLGDIWRGGDPYPMLARLPSTRRRIEALDQLLLSRSLSAHPADARVRRAVDLLHAARGVGSIAALAREVGISERQLERAFAVRVGVGPKSLARAIRLSELVSRIDAVPRPVFAALAADLGYADQAHLVLDVRRLTGITPSELFRERRRNAMSESSNPPRTAVASLGA